VGTAQREEADDMVAHVRNEMRYRMLLQHDYHTSRTWLAFFLFSLLLTRCVAVTLPLWSPNPVLLGAVGYLSKPAGSFVTLFNVFDPAGTSGGAASQLPRLNGYGEVAQGSQRQDRRSATQRGYDFLQGFIARKKDEQGMTCVTFIYLFISC